jgi:hypothetical protein
MTFKNFLTEAKELSPLKSLAIQLNKILKVKEWFENGMDRASKNLIGGEFKNEEIEMNKDAGYKVEVILKEIDKLELPEDAKEKLTKLFAEANEQDIEYKLESIEIDKVKKLIKEIE